MTWETFPLNAAFRILASQQHNTVFYAPANKATNLVRSRVDAWIDFAIGLDRPLKAWCYPIWGFAPMVDRDFHIARASVENMLIGMEKALKEATYLVGHSMTLADLSIALRLVPAYLTVSTTFSKMQYLTCKWQKKSPNRLWKGDMHLMADSFFIH